VLAIESERGPAAPSAATGCRVFGVPLGDDAHADVLTLITALRRAGVRADMTFGSRGLKGAMKAADRSGARFAVIIGAEDKNAGTVRLKDLENGDQQDVAVTSATDWLLEKLGLGQQA
jgi:histidyl-tRNA synthetase